MRGINKDARAELELIREEAGGMLKAEDVLDFARSSNTALHKYFEWDDGEAAYKYRLAQAKEIISVAVIMIPGTDKKVRAYVNLSEDRKERLGYRSIVDVYSDEQLLEMLLQDALEELQAFKAKYEKLKSLAKMADLFQEIDEVLPKAKKPTKKSSKKTTKKKK